MLLTITFSINVVQCLRLRGDSSLDERRRLGDPSLDDRRLLGGLGDLIRGRSPEGVIASDDGLLMLPDGSSR